MEVIFLTILLVLHIGICLAYLRKSTEYEKLKASCDKAYIIIDHYEQYLQTETIEDILSKIENM